MTEWVIAQFMRASPKATIECMRAIARICTSFSQALTSEVMESYQIPV
jgi:hypothetical protein